MSTTPRICYTPPGGVIIGIHLGDSNRVGAGVDAATASTDYGPNHRNLKNPQSGILYAPHKELGGMTTVDSGWTTLRPIGTITIGSVVTFGPELVQLVDLADLGHAVAGITFGRGGQNADDFATGATGAAAVAYINDRLDDIGVPYVIGWLDLVLGVNDGEDADLADAFDVNIEAIVQRVKDEVTNCPADLRTSLWKLHGGVPTGTVPNRDTIRAKGATWAAGAPNVRKVYDIDEQANPGVHPGTSPTTLYGQRGAVAARPLLFRP